MPYTKIHRTVYRKIVLFFVLASFGFGCTTHHQILKFKTSEQKHENLIPGIESEESLNKIKVLVTGNGLEPETGSPQQRKLLAERAAVIDGYRKLSERLAGTIIKVYSESGNNNISKDQVTSETNAYLRGAQVLSIDFQNGMATANVAVYIEPRQLKFMHGSELSRAIIGALGGASLGAATAAGIGIVTGSSMGVITEAVGIGSAIGAAGGWITNGFATQQWTGRNRFGNCGRR